MTSTNLMGPSRKAAPTADPLSATLDALEALLFNTTPTPQPIPVTETSGLVPIVTADLITADPETLVLALLAVSIQHNLVRLRV